MKRRLSKISFLSPCYFLKEFSVDKCIYEVDLDFIWNLKSSVVVVMYCII